MSALSLVGNTFKYTIHFSNETKSVIASVCNVCVYVWLARSIQTRVHTANRRKKKTSQFSDIYWRTILLQFQKIKVNDGMCVMSVSGKECCAVLSICVRARHPNERTNVTKRSVKSNIRESSSEPENDAMQNQTEECVHITIYDIVHFFGQALFDIRDRRTKSEIETRVEKSFGAIVRVSVCR